MNLVLTKRAGGLYGRILTEVASVRSVPATEVKILPYKPTLLD